MESQPSEASTSESEPVYTHGVRLIVLNLPEDEGEGLGFRLTRTLWDPYPWVREVISKSRAATAGLKAGDCLLQADGKDLLGLPVRKAFIEPLPTIKSKIRVSVANKMILLCLNFEGEKIGQVAGMIRGDGAGRGVSLLVWNCGVDPSDDPELLWSCGGGARGERARRALAGAVRALACCVCASTATVPLCCARSHLYCEACWKRLERCALCREPLPPKESPYARNLVAEQVFEAIATEYEIKNVKKRPTESASACTTPNRSPSMSPSTHRRGQYQLSMMNRKKVQFTEKFGQTYASDPNIHRSTNQEFKRTSLRSSVVQTARAGNTETGGKCKCQTQNSLENMQRQEIPAINVESVDENVINLSLQHKLVARLRQSCSLADLQNTIPICSMSRSLNSLGDQCKEHDHHSSLDNLKMQCHNTSDAPVFLLSAPPIYVVACDHSKIEIPNSSQVKT